MKILCFNVGSSSFKWSVLEMPSEEKLAGGDGVLRAGTLDPGDLAALAEHGKGAAAVAHRFVNGGPGLRSTVAIDAGVRATLERLRGLDPTHLPAALAGLDASQRAFPQVRQFGCFDTAFHATLPEAAFVYAVPEEWTTNWGVRRYGFHGLSVAHAVRRASALLGEAKTRLLVCHLGSGSSITAVSDGRSRDTTMGFTPLEGVPMNTRSGSVDPGILLYALREKGLDPAALEEALERQSGLRGLFGGSGDLREVLAAADRGDPRAGRAYGVLLAGLRRGLGSMLAALDGLDAIVFTGGIGEHQPRLRADLLSPLAWLGIALDPQRNRAPVGDQVISSSGSRISVLCVQAREDLTMAREVVRLLAA
jgi:acetate kinase